MAQFTKMVKVELTTGAAPVVQMGRIFYSDVQAQRIGVIVTLEGQAVSLSGTCSGTAILNDGSTVPLTGTVSGNEAYIDLDSSCYAVEGPIQIFLKLTSGGVVTTLLAAVGTVSLTETGTVIDPGTVIPSVSALIEAIEDAVDSIPADYSALLATIAPTFSSSTAYVAGTYAWYSGTLYRFTVDHAAGSWTGSDAVSVVIGAELATLKSAINETFALSMHQFTIVDKYNFLYGKEGDWVAENNCVIESTDNGVKVVASTGLRIVVKNDQGFGIEPNDKFGLHIKIYSTKQVTMNVYLRVNSITSVWSQALSLSVGWNEFVFVDTLTGVNNANLIYLITAANSMLSTDYVIIDKCEVINLSNTFGDIDSGQFKILLLYAENKINDYATALYADDIPNSSQTFVQEDNTITITHRMTNGGFSAVVRTDTVVETATSFVETRELIYPAATMIITTNKTSKYTEVEVNGL